MGREIKFRAWDKERGVMLYDSEGEYPYVSDTQFIKIVHDGVLHADAPDMGHYGGGDWSYKDGEFEIMQYTGLKDHNGQKVFDKDLLLHPNGQTYTVEWHNLGWAIKGDRLYIGWQSEVMTIIGNIYESPELIHGT